MSTARIFQWLGRVGLFYALMSLLTAIFGLFMGELNEARNFAVCGILTGVIALIIVLATQKAPTQERTKDALIFLMLFWLIIPFVVVIPFVLNNEISSKSVAYFEAVSALSTTGASTLDADSLSFSILLWRSLLQWSGGVLVVTFAIIFLAALNLRGPGIHRSTFFTLQEGELFSRLQSLTWVVAKIYLLISLVCFLVLQLLGTEVFDALCLSLTSVSTGGLTPRSGPLASYVGEGAAFVLAITCFLGAVNVTLLHDIGLRKQGSIRNLFSNAETRGLVVMCVLLFVTALYFVGYEHVHTILVESVFLATTTGFDYHVIGVDIVPVSIVMAFALVGGSALSTAGGLKIIRLLLLVRHLRTNLERMTHPSRVMPVLFQGRHIKDKSFMSIWMYFFAYTFTLAFGMVLLGAVGLDFSSALIGSAAALSNMGPLLDLSGSRFGYADMNGVQLFILSVLMVLGRIEILVAFAAFTPSLWLK